MIVRMVATFQYVDQVGCGCSSSPAGAWSAASAESGVMLAWVSIVAPLPEQVDESKDHDPDDVDEVPIQRADVDQQGIPRSKSAPVINREQRPQPEHA